jgi:class 3 adenylate cyclase
LTKFYEDNKIKVELSDILHNATLLFADIAGFTAYSAAHEAEEVVNMLKHLMTEFDKLCLENTVYKVYTIGGTPHE